MIQGTALSAAGKPLPRASIYYARTSPVKGKTTGAVLPPVLSAKAGWDGSFTLSNLPPGSWTVCVEVVGYLDPCHWSTAPTFLVSAGQSSLKAEVRLEQAFLLYIHVNDPQGLLANEGKAAGALLQIGIHAPSGAFQRANIAARDRKGRDYTVAMSPYAAARLFVHGGSFQLNDDTGSQIAKGGKITQVAAPDTNKTGVVSQAPLSFTVTGFGKL